jgi:hypothetical protein
MEFKVGDRVRPIKGEMSEGEEEGIINGLPGVPEYDSKTFLDAEHGMTFEDGRWWYREYWALVKPSRSKKKPAKRKGRKIKAN